MRMNIRIHAICRGIMAKGRGDIYTVIEGITDGFAGAAATLDVGGVVAGVEASGGFIPS
jgi:hypothetical protein